MARKTRKELTVDNAVNSSLISEKVYKTAVYVRLSVEDIRKKISDSIGTQKAMLLQYIQTQSDLQLYKIYEDINYTGTNFNRPGFTKMIEDVQSGAIDCVVIKDLSRFGRNFEETGHYLEQVFPFLQIRLVSVNDNYDSLTATLDETTLIVPLKNLINEVYARDISKKVQSGFKQKQNRGEFCGSFAPYGYIKNGDSFIVDEETAPVVKQIFTWVTEKYSDIAIAQKLNGLKITPPSRYRFEKGITKAKKHEDTKFWYKSAIKRITENPAYTGILAQGKYQSNFLNGNGRIEKNRDEWIIRENAHTAIIEKEIFDTVQKIRLQRKESVKNNKSNSNNENIFKGLIFCADCKKNMYRHKSRRADGSIDYSFLCNVYEQVDKNACTKKQIKETDLREALYYYIDRQIKLVVDISHIIQNIKKEHTYKEQNDTFDKQINELKQELQQNQRYRGSLREDYVDGVINEQDYINMKSEYEEEKNTLQNELDLLVSNKFQHDAMLSGENKCINEFRKFENERNLSAQMVSALIERIEVMDYNRVKVYFKYRDELNYILSYIGNKEQEAANATHE
ncbi:MAG: recombinase family protein [Oscillospiraceae bacterium]|nr:recombinase family protein [Oscillospiraceae bacterium]